MKILFGSSLHVGGKLRTVSGKSGWRQAISGVIREPPLTPSNPAPNPIPAPLQPINQVLTADRPSSDSLGFPLRTVGAAGPALCWAAGWVVACAWDELAGGCVDAK
jgi:hypothetical protein